MAKVIYQTPGRECAHADKGCCPKCYDPAGLLRSTKEFRRRHHWRGLKHPHNPNAGQERNRNG